MRSRLFLLSILLLSATCRLNAGPPLEIPGGPRTPAAKLEEPKKKLPPVVIRDPVHPDKDCDRALAHLSVVSEETRPYIRFFSFQGVPDEYLARFQTIFLFFLNTASTAQPLVIPTEVRGSNGRLFALDIRSPRWTVEGFRVVAHRDRIFREPNITSLAAESLRQQLHLRQDKKIYHVEAVIWAPEFVRDLMETDRSETLYDLLYSNERFGDYSVEHKKPVSRPWTGGVWPGDGKEYQAGSFTFIPRAEQEAYDKAIASKTTGKTNRNFPENVGDWDKKWGIEAVNKFLKEQRLSVQNGEVVAGAKSDPLKGSYVAYHDRVITFLPVPSGVAMRTFDSLKTALAKNYANFPKEVFLNEVPFDAGELLVTLPNGLQTALLINGQGKRVELADSRIARSSLDPHQITVLTQYSCVICHAPVGGVITPSNKKITEAISRGNLLLAKDPELQTDLEGFFTKWDYKLPVWRLPYSVGLKGISVTVGRPAGWTGKNLADEVMFFRDWYDGPVTLSQAAAELGVPRLAVILACMHEGSIDAGDLILDNPISRDAWDNDLYGRLVLILDYLRSGETIDPVFGMLYPNLYRPHSK